MGSLFSWANVTQSSFFVDTCGKCEKSVEKERIYFSLDTKANADLRINLCTLYGIPLNTN
jgi:hypothetical protein